MRISVWATERSRHFHFLDPSRHHFCIRVVLNEDISLLLNLNLYVVVGCAVRTKLWRIFPCAILLLGNRVGISILTAQFRIKNQLSCDSLNGPVFGAMFVIICDPTTDQSGAAFTVFPFKWLDEFLIYFVLRIHLSCVGDARSCFTVCSRVFSRWWD